MQRPASILITGLRRALEILAASETSGRRFGVSGPDAQANGRSGRRPKPAGSAAHAGLVTHASQDPDPLVSMKLCDKPHAPVALQQAYFHQAVFLRGGTMSGDAKLGLFLLLAVLAIMMIAPVLAG